MVAPQLRSLNEMPYLQMAHDKPGRVTSLSTTAQRRAYPCRPFAARSPPCSRAFWRSSLKTSASAVARLPASDTDSSSASTLFPAPSPVSPINYAGNGAATFNGNQVGVIRAAQAWLIGGSYMLSAWIKTSAGGQQDILKYDLILMGCSWFW